ncbi:hypothetical protein SBOR_7928 [Sclerotinia borealis F-4128]|uniref:Uncharacterized protein n=1 Tax=Sclerotinia borealis (strain F-4128) TaxID=1432307 RepID=W9C733_SCLBF|nr:hypothetical protein SBOR_7928 [Sclerotinia borealis F-4128]
MILVQHINTSGNEDDKLMAYQSRVIFFYLRTDGEAYTQAISTCWDSDESTERFKLNMNYAVFEADINYDQIYKNAEKIHKVFNILMTENFEEYVVEAGVTSKISVGNKDTQPGEPSESVSTDSSGY